MKKSKREKRRKRMSPLLKLLILLVIIGGIFAFLHAPMFNVTTYEVSGNAYYSEDEILVMGNCKTGGNIFWGSNLGEIKTRLSKDAYMQEVTVRRVLPATVSIEVVERQQMAAVVYGEKYIVIDKEGIALRKTSTEPKVTIIRGLTISKLSMGEPIEAEERVLLRQTLEMLNSMQDHEMYFKKVEISTRQISGYVYDHLICQGTPENLNNAMISGRLQLVIQELMNREIERGIIKVSESDYISFTPKLS